MASGARDTVGSEPPAGATGAGGETFGHAGLRSLPGARSRHAEVTGRLVESARDLVWDAGGPNFTVNQVVAAAGTSLKSFYRCFAGKDELLVALFEDDARRGADALAEAVDRYQDPVARVRCAVEGLFGFISVD